VTEAARELNEDPESAASSMQVLCVKHGDQVILFDTGLGEGELPVKLASVGVSADDVTVVVITHAHGDHVGGLTTPGTDEVVYPNARYVMHQLEWESWTSDAFLNGLKPEDAENTRKRQSAIQPKLTLLVEDGVIVPGIDSIHSPGHTPGHVAVLLQSQGEKLLHIVDAAHHPVQVAHPEWSPAFDADTSKSVPSRRMLFERAAAENIPVLTYHFAFPGMGHVTHKGDRLVWQQV
jgi:glyoxylase-like metal-dependent hydrolase (beta-lactamase superfamily II)